MSSFKEYILVHQDEAVVETFFREEQNFWHISRTIGIDQVLELKSIGLNLSMERLYHHLNLDK